MGHPGGVLLASSCGPAYAFPSATTEVPGPRRVPAGRARARRRRRCTRAARSPRSPRKPLRGRRGKRVAVCVSSAVLPLEVPDAVALFLKVFETVFDMHLARSKTHGSAHLPSCPSGGRVAGCVGPRRPRGPPGAARCSRARRPAASPSAARAAARAAAPPGSRGARGTPPSRARCRRHPGTVVPSFLICIQEAALSTLAN